MLKKQKANTKKNKEYFKSLANLFVQSGNPDIFGICLRTTSDRDKEVTVLTRKGFIVLDNDF